MKQLFRYSCALCLGGHFGISYPNNQHKTNKRTFAASRNPNYMYDILFFQARGFQHEKNISDQTRQINVDNKLCKYEQLKKIPLKQTKN
jgi:hypothetical protein